jgi:hypothetical protein
MVRAYGDDFTAGAAPAVPETVTVVSRGRAISWGAALAGAAIMLAIQLLLSTLGIGVGLGMINPGQGDTPGASTLGIGGGVWWAVSYFIALFAGGYVAARLAGRLLPWDGALHGLLTWAVTLLVTFYLLTTALGGLMGGALNALGSTVSAAGSGLKEAVPQVAQAAGVSTDTIQDKAKQLLSAQPTNADPKSLNADQAQQEITANLPKLVAGDEQGKRAARDRIVAVIAAQANITPQEANARLDQLQNQASQTKDQVVDTARNATDKAASGLSIASILGFVVLLIGAGLAGVGGHVGAHGRSA